MTPESAATQDSSVIPSHQHVNKEAVVRNHGEDAYVRWRLAWEKQRRKEDERIQELDRRIDGLRSTLPNRGSGSGGRSGGRRRSRSPRPSPGPGPGPGPCPGHGLSERLR